MHGAAYYELTGGIIKKNPAYPDVPPVRKMKNIRSIINNLGIVNTLYDFVGNERIAQLLNHPAGRHSKRGMAEILKPARITPDCQRVVTMLEPPYKFNIQQHLGEG